MVIETRALALTGIAFAAAFVPAIMFSAGKAAPAAATSHSAVFDQQQFWQVSKIYCDGCHFGPKARAKLNLQSLDFAHLDANGETWEKVLRKLRSREMPPVGMPRPDAAIYEKLVSSIEAERDRLAEVKPNPGRPTIHRLNRAEYKNAVRDLLALDIDVEDMLPADDIGYGFDNIGDVLSVSPLLLERYLSAASKIGRTAIGETALPATYRTYDVPRGLIQLGRMSEDMPFGSRGGATIRHYFPADGEYEIAAGLQRGRYDQFLGLERERKLDIRIDGKRVKLFAIPADPRARAVVFGAGNDPDANLRVKLPVKAGMRTITATFLKDTVIPEGIIQNDRETAFYEGVGSITIGGPFSIKGPGVTDTREAIFVCRPSAQVTQEVCARQILSALTRRAYRRPVTEEDLAPLLKLYSEGQGRGGFETGIRLALQTILVSPEFLFRVELDPEGAAPGAVHKIDGIELASRLSFFLWSSIPDEALLAAAEREELDNPQVLEREVKRMLADPRAKSLVTNFAGQWLFLRNIDRIAPDPAAFPNFDENLREAFRTETEMLIASIMNEDKSILDLLTAEYTFVNDRLAEHYGIAGIYGSEFRRVPVRDENRRGLLGHASILTVTSYPNRTSPTIRGKWVLEQLLGTPPPPPPPNVPSLAENANVQEMSMRERMELHRANPACAACHRMMDPLGFSLENYDGLGRWRDTAGPGTGSIDASGVLPDGAAFNGPSGLREVLMSKSDRFAETFTERLLTYALGRGVEEYDRPVIRKIVREASGHGQRWSDIVLGIVTSTPFQMRRVSDDRL